MRQHIFHELPITSKKLLWLFIAIAFAVAALVDGQLETKQDSIFHDTALVKTPRMAWHNTAIIALDSGIPGYISRRQALPLFGLAAQRAIDMGATAVFLDAVLYEFDPRTRYTSCIEKYHQLPIPNEFRWEEAQNIIPFATFSPETLKQFFIATPYFMQDDDFLTMNLLQPYFGEALLPIDYFDDEMNHQALERLIASPLVYQREDGNFQGSNRWMNLLPNAVIPKVTQLHQQMNQLPQPQANYIEQCEGHPCQRVRFSSPQLNFNETTQFPVVPVSKLVGCDLGSGYNNFARLFDNRIVILQMTEPNEATDIKITPMLSALGAPKEFITGPQYLVDAIETHLQQDGPVRPYILVRWLLLLLIAIMSVWGAAFLKTGYVFWFPPLTGAMVWGLCFITAPWQLWPVTVAIFCSVLSITLVIATHISLGTAKSKIMARYIPKQIHSLLLKSGKDQTFIHRHIDAVILMSDIAKYSNVTSELKEPEYIFALLNDYFEKTTLNTQHEFQGWLESYVGDMVCFYWPVVGNTDLRTQQELALRAALEMANLQQVFFKRLSQNKKIRASKETMKKVSEFIGAGIGLTSGEVMMGNLGPDNGVQKFGCLGDPLNLASRTESLTRYFNTEILITDELAPIAKELGIAIRRIVSVVVKGRITPVTLYAMGNQSDERFRKDTVEAWELWVQDNRGGVNAENLPEHLKVFELDADTIGHWTKQGIYDPKQDCFLLKVK